MNWPTPPSGNSNEASFMRRLVDCCKRSVPVAGINVTAKETASGIILSAQASGGTQQAGSPIYMFAITQMLGLDYVLAKYWNGSSLGKEIKIAKSPRLRPSVASELVEGITISFTPILTNPYDPLGDNNRQATDVDGTESQVIFPRYTTLDQLGIAAPTTPVCEAIIFAQQASNGTGLTGVDWVEVLPHRVWTKRTA